MKIKAPKIQAAFTARFEQDGAVVYDHTVADEGMMEFVGWKWDAEIEEHLPDLVPMYSDLTLLTDPDLPDEVADRVLRDFFEYIRAHRKEAAAMARQRRKQVYGK